MNRYNIYQNNAACSAVDVMTVADKSLYFEAACVLGSNNNLCSAHVYYVLDWK